MIVTDAHAYAHRTSFLVNDLLAAMDGAGVARAVLTPPSGEGDRNDYAVAAATAQPDRLAVMIRLDVTRPLMVRDLGERVSEPGVLGVRLTFTRGAAAGRLTGGVAGWLWPMLENLGVPVAIYASGNLGIIGDIARTHPGLRVTLDDAGLPLGARGAELESALAQSCALAALPNVSVTASSMPSHTDEAFPFPSVRGPIRRLVDAYGPGRVFWGSDLTRLRCSYAEAVALFAEHAGLSGDEVRLVMGDALAAWMSWPV